ncbi:MULTISPECIES: type I-D CRISPR-associated protein Cas10d/Csc3 [Cyanophyceae]|uniref:type I-D CRISPR-associated protein Cas10d/Csc3 n=1 Tax=Cyanophyceae TaxID=3028117 RepID=UPI00016DCE15|nr:MULTISPECIES: type I-D CRISPR-associated protein Cas10d/Csc3 [Cyanophyceae]ACB00886.1 conserved hypothetical protein [Picosynechococcus sp. PCC 7002]SMH58978.1 CRISPR-associated protein Csc3 [Picosynechococcus sp. OG1]SMQ86523.1 CRISPR-associated protein Csc3 [Synechococcus sp. 7002]
MTTLLQTLLIRTLPEQTDSILLEYFQTILPALEEHFGNASGLGGSFISHQKHFERQGYDIERAQKIAQSFAKKGDQTLAAHILNALLTTWNVMQELDVFPNAIEQRLLCLGITLHDYDKHCHAQDIVAPNPDNVQEIINICLRLGERLNFDGFWLDWRNYIAEISYLAQNTHGKQHTNLISSNWSNAGYPFTIKERKLDYPLRHLLTFGDIAVHLTSPHDLVSSTMGDRLRDLLSRLSIEKRLVYHHLRDTTGILSNAIHNVTLRTVQKLNWKPLLFFAQGVIYLAPQESEIPERDEIKQIVWQGISEELGKKMSAGDVGFKRDGKGLKVSPQTSELLTAADIVRILPQVISVKVNNAKSPATPKRLEKLELSDAERERLNEVADLRCDRLAELLGLVQKEIFLLPEPFIEWVLKDLELTSVIALEETQVQSGGVNYGWYRVAAHYIANHATWDLEEFQEFLQGFGDRLATWAEEEGYFAKHQSPTRQIFEDYLDRYLEIQGWKSDHQAFIQELKNYINAKTKKSKQPICSLSSGEFPSEDQMDSVVLFKPQQYSNKNALGGGQIKRGISKIWSLEMLLRQAFWSATAGKFEDQQPIFIYLYPAYVYAPQVVEGIRELVHGIASINLWDVRKHWVNNKMNLASLKSLPWLNEDVELGTNSQLKYTKEDLPFLATVYTTSREKTDTDAWVKPAFLALLLPYLLGVKAIATRSMVPLYRSDQDFRESIHLDGVAGFWSLLGISTDLRVEDIAPALNKLLAIYTLHLAARSSPPKARWQDLPKTVQEVMTDVLNVFALAEQGLRREKRDRPYDSEITEYWQFAEIFSQGNIVMTEKLKLTKRLVEEYRKFYQVRTSDSSHAILLPLSKALEQILSVPDDWDEEELILQGSGQLQAALDRQEVYTRPIIKDKSVAYETRQLQELEAIQTFMTTCVRELFGEMCKGDRAILQEQRNRIKSGAEFAYRLLALETQQNQN